MQDSYCSTSILPQDVTLVLGCPTSPKEQLLDAPSCFNMRELNEFSDQQSLCSVEAQFGVGYFVQMLEKGCI